MKLKKKLAFFIIISALLIVLSLKLDNTFIRFILLIRNSFLTQIFLGVAFVSSEIIIFFFLTSLFLWNERKRKWILPLWMTFFLSVIISYGLKIIIQKQRPVQLGLISLLTNETFSSWNSSFPSFQSMLVFSAIPILSKEFKKFKYVWVFFALLVGISRVYVGAHFLSDVVVGGIIGYIIGILIVYNENKAHTWSKIYEFLFGKNN